MKAALPDYSVRHSPKAKNLRLKVTREDGLLVVVPKGYDEKKIPALLKQKKVWIADSLKRIGETKRFLTSPKNCEVTGVITTPDGKTMFVGIQHPGEDWTTEFTDNSTWPDFGRNGATTNSGKPLVYKPRSGVVVITKNDGGVIGTAPAPEDA